MPAVWASASDTVSSKEGAARPKPAASSWFGKLSKSYRTLAFASIAFVSVIIHVVANMLVDGSRGQCGRPPNGGDNLRPRRRAIHCPSNRLLRRPVSSNIGQSWGCCCGGSLHVRNGASAGRNQFVPARLLGPDIRHSSLHVFAGFSSLVRREETKRWRDRRQRFGQRDYTDFQRRLRAC